MTSIGPISGLFGAENVTSIWGIKRSLWRSWQLMFLFQPGKFFPRKRVHDFFIFRGNIFYCSIIVLSVSYCTSFFQLKNSKMMSFEGHWTWWECDPLIPAPGKNQSLEKTSLDIFFHVKCFARFCPSTATILSHLKGFMMSFMLCFCLGGSEALGKCKFQTFLSRILMMSSTAKRSLPKNFTKRSRKWSCPIGFSYSMGSVFKIHY